MLRHWPPHALAPIPQPSPAHSMAPVCAPPARSLAPVGSWFPSSPTAQSLGWLQADDYTLVLVQVTTELHSTSWCCDRGKVVVTVVVPTTHFWMVKVGYSLSQQPNTFTCVPATPWVWVRVCVGLVVDWVCASVFWLECCQPAQRHHWALGWPSLLSLHIRSISRPSHPRRD